MKHVSDEQHALVIDLRKALRSKQHPKRCPKHPDAPSRFFTINEPGRKPKARWLCVECAGVLVDWHGATLTKGPKT